MSRELVALSSSADSLTAVGRASANAQGAPTLQVPGVSASGVGPASVADDRQAATARASDRPTPEARNDRGLVLVAMEGPTQRGRAWVGPGAAEVNPRRAPVLAGL